MALTTQRAAGSSTPDPHDAAPAPASWSTSRTVVVALLVLVGCWLGALTGTLIVPRLGNTILFLPYATLTAALMLSPSRVWWLLLVAAVLGTAWPLDAVRSWPGAVLVAESALAVSALVAAAGIRVLRARPGSFSTLTDMSLLIVFAAVLGPLVGALVGAAALLLDGGGTTFWAAWEAWVLPTALAGLTVLPVILRAATRPVWKVDRPRKRRLVEALVLYGGLVVVGLRILEAAPGGDVANGLYQLLPFLLWAAVRFGSGGAVGALTVISALTVADIAGATGGLAVPPPAETLLQPLLFLIAVAVPVMLLAAVVQERAQSAADLRRSKLQYETIVEDQTELICRFLPDGTLTFVNRACWRFFGIAPGQLLGTSAWPYVPAEDHTRVAKVVGSITPSNPVASLEQAVRRADGELRIHHWTHRGFFDENGQVVEYQAVGHDITRTIEAERERRQLELQRQAQKILRASEQRFHRLVDNAPVLIWMSGLENEGTLFNKTWLDFTGRTLEEELGYGWVYSVHPDDIDHCTRTCNEAFARREPLSMHFRLRRHDGEYRWVLDNGVPFFGPDGAFNGYIGTCVDITERLRAEEELETAARRKDEFLAMLGHELRNPLAPIALAMDVLRASASADESVAWAEEVVTRQLGQLTRLVDDLMDVSRISHGTIRLNLEALDLCRIVSQAVETSTPVLSEHHHKLSVEMHGGAIAVRGDAVRLVQAFCNLLNNAAKYTDAGGTIGVVVERTGENAEVRITDNGSGIPVQMLESVFDMYTQVDGPRERGERGMGVGLTLVKQLIELHRGTIHAKSEGVGRGSEFIVRLPLVSSALLPPNGGAAPRVERPARSNGAPSERRRILVVDDNADAAVGMARVLRTLGHEVFLASDGVAALTSVADLDPDVVLLDIGLPKMNGFEVARRLRMRSGARPLLLIATTGLGQLDDRLRSEAVGFDHHLTKPIGVDSLIAVLQHDRPVHANR